MTLDAQQSFLLCNLKLMNLFLVSVLRKLPVIGTYGFTIREKVFSVEMDLC